MTATSWLLGFSMLSACSVGAGLACKTWASVAVIFGAVALGLASPHETSVTVTALLVPMVVSVLLRGAVQERITPDAMLGGAFAVLGQFLLVAIANRWMWLAILPGLLAIMRLGKLVQPRTAMWLLGVPVAATAGVLLATLP